MAVARLGSPSHSDVARFRNQIVRLVQQSVAAHYRAHLTNRLSRLNDHSRILRPRARLVKSLSTNTVTMSLEMPGMNKSDVHINVQNGQLIVSGERRPTPKPEGDASVVDDELIYGRFMKIMQLPSGVGLDQISASMVDGMLTLCWPMPSLPPVHKPQKIIAI